MVVTVKAPGAGMSAGCGSMGNTLWPGATTGARSIANAVSALNRGTVFVQFIGGEFVYTFGRSDAHRWELS
jgi:hypothetical protein